MRSIDLTFFAATLIAALACTAVAHAEDAVDAGLESMSLEELLSVEVYTASKRNTSAYETAAAITVITSEDLRRQGTATLVDALEWVPGIQFQRLNASNTAVGIRGFTGVLSDKLLVLIDGRSIYSLFYSGVYWDEHALPIEDIERIEIIRGPGGTLWGANAVNGVVNIVTRHASETEGWTAGADVAADETSLAVRGGGSLGENAHGRLWVTSYDRGAYDTAPDHYGGGGWRNVSLGSRVDMDDVAGGSLFLSLGAHTVETERQDLLHDPQTRVDYFTEPGKHETLSLNGQARWERPIGRSTTLALQGWFEHHDRDERIFAEVRTSTDLDAQITRTGDRHTFVAGANLRVSSDEILGSSTYDFSPSKRSLTWSSVFLQDEIRLTDRLRFTAGWKVEHNDFSGFEHQPNARVGLDTGRLGFIWGAVSRAVRTPSRAYTSTLANRSLEGIGLPGLPTVVQFVPQRDPESENLLAVELGWRRMFGEKISVDVTSFVHEYDDLIYQAIGLPTIQNDGISTPYIGVPAEIVSGLEMTARGVETMMDVQPAERLLLRFGYTFLDLSRSDPPLDSDRHSGAAYLNNNVEDSPTHVGFARMRVNPAPDWDVDLGLRVTSALDDVPVGQPITRASVGGTTELSARIAWRPYIGTEVALVGRNLVDGGRVDFYDRTEIYPSAAIPTQVFLQVRVDH